MRRICLFIMLMVLTFQGVASSIWKNIYGAQPQSSSIQFGSLVYHFLQVDKKIFFPFVTVTSKNSLFVNFFENTYRKFGMAVGIHRDWYQHDFDNGHGVRFGYELGIIYGYCFKIGLKCHDGDRFPKNMKFIPGLALDGDYFFNKDFGISLTWAGSIFKSDLIYRW